MWLHNLKKIVIPPETSLIGDDVFYGDNSLEEISMYSKIKQIGPGVINYCTGLRKINYAGTAEQFQKISHIPQHPHLRKTLADR